MSFAHPQLLWALLLPLALLAWEMTHRRRANTGLRPKILRAEAGPASLNFTPQPAAASVHAPRFWLCAGLALAVVALARPQWGRIEEPVFDQSREILLAVDLSRSMLAQDVKPSRLDRTKLLIQSLLEKLAGERVGLVVFSGTSFLQAPLSADYEILREFLPALGPEFLPEGGTNYGAMLDTTLQAFGTTNTADRFLVVLSDGEATDTDWKGRIAELKKKSIRVLALGVGTAGGGMIPDPSGGLVKDERGAVVLSKLESATLQELASATSGVYRDASTWIDLANLVNETVEAGRKGEFVEKNTIRLVERFQWPLAFALWCLLVSFYYEFPVRPKPRNVSLRGAPGVRPTEAPSGVRSQLTKAAAVLLLVLAPGLLLPLPVKAAAKLAPAADKPEEPPVLAKIVGRLSAAENRTARDWAELGRETVTWGSRLRSEHKPVPEGPVNDALGAVDLGEKLDAKATDWAKLREELRALLKTPDEEEKKNKDDKKQPPDRDQQNKKKPDQNQNPDQQEKQDQEQSQKGDEKSEKNQSDADKKEKPEEKTNPDESALGEMKKDDQPPPPPPENVQQVGGQQEKKDDQPKEQMDPALALPLQKLDQLRNQDSPAHLFQLMDGDRKSEKKPAQKSGKNW